MFGFFKQRITRRRKAQALYQSCAEQARLPVFFKELGVPDTVDGRYEMVALHCFMTIARLNKAGEVKRGQALFDVFFVNMDRVLREMGVGDLGVPKHMKRMMQGFNGRRLNYQKALETKDVELLKEALIRNVYGTVEPPAEDSLLNMARYVQDSYDISGISAEFAPILPNIQEVKHA